MSFNFSEIPPPQYLDPRCGLVECCVCGCKCVLYWLKDEVWRACQAHASCCGGHLCVPHAEIALGRKLTLGDLAVDKYVETVKSETSNGGPQRANHCIVDTLIGAAIEAGVDFPTNWCSMWDDYINLGKTLSSQTIDAANEVRRLVYETTLHFPTFSNPYEV